MDPVEALTLEQVKVTVTIVPSYQITLVNANFTKENLAKPSYVFHEANLLKEEELMFGNEILISIVVQD